MTKEQQDLTWKCLPKEVRKEIKEYYQILCNQKEEYINLHFENACSKVQERMVTLEYLFDKDNITSNTEIEEMLVVERSKVVTKIH